jgi:hypothetical protein
MYNFIMIMTSPQMFIIGKNIYETLDVFENNDGDNKIYQEKVWELTNKRKVNSTSTISSIRAGPKVRLRVPLCCMVLMPIMRHALKGDITKLEVDFSMVIVMVTVYLIYRPPTLRKFFNLWMMRFVHLGAQIELKPMPCLNLNWIQTCHSCHTKYNVFNMSWQSQFFCLEKLYCPRIYPRL